MAGRTAGPHNPGALIAPRPPLHAFRAEEIEPIARVAEEQPDALVFAHPARILAAQDERAVPAELADRARAIAPDPTIFDTNPPYFWRAEISSNRLDSYFTNMDARTSLRNYAADATEGIPFQNSHNVRQLSLGRSLRGQFYGAQGNGVARTEADFYTLQGLRLADVATDDFINGIRGGLIGDVSIGFRGGEHVCSICGRDMMSSWECWHFPGLYYDPDDKDGFVEPAGPDVPNRVLCTALITNARLVEVSAVYNGATPGAGIIKAYRAAEAGELSQRVVQQLESRFRLALPPAPRRTPVRSPHPQEEAPMAGTPQKRGGDAAPAPETAAPPAPPAPVEIAGEIQTLDVEVASLEPIRAALEVAGVPDGLEPVAGIRWLVTERARLAPLESQLATVEGDLAALRREIEQLRPLAGEVRELRPLRDEVQGLREQVARIPTLEDQARDGATYRKDLIADALTEGVRAFGPEWDKEGYKALLEDERIALVMIRRMRDDWKAVAGKALPSGRQTVDSDLAREDGAAEGAEPAPDDEAPADEAPARVRRVPNAAYIV